MSVCGVCVVGMGGVGQICAEASPSGSERASYERSNVVTPGQAPACIAVCCVFGWYGFRCWQCVAVGHSSRVAAVSATSRQYGDARASPNVYRHVFVLGGSIIAEIVALCR